MGAHIVRTVSGRGLRERIAQGFTRIEDAVYVGLGLLLAGTAVFMLINTGIMFGQGLLRGTLVRNIIGLLDQILLILMIVEILYTVQVSFRQHILTAEPFLLVALIAGVRRVLVLTAGFAELMEQNAAAFRNSMLELGLLTLLIVALVASLIILRSRNVSMAAERA